MRTALDLKLNNIEKLLESESLSLSLSYSSLEESQKASWLANQFETLFAPVEKEWDLKWAAWGLNIMIKAGLKGLVCISQTTKITSQLLSNFGTEAKVKILWFKAKLKLTFSRGNLFNFKQASWLNFIFSLHTQIVWDKIENWYRLVERYEVEEAFLSCSKHKVRSEE